MVSHGRAAYVSGIGISIWMEIMDGNTRRRNKTADSGSTVVAKAVAPTDE